MKHEADGAYYLNYRILRKLNACSVSIKWWLRKFGKSQKVPVTLKLVREYYDTFLESRRDLYWLGAELFCRNKVTLEESDSFFGGFLGGYPPTVFMDLLARRAKREGLLS